MTQIRSVDNAATAAPFGRLSELENGRAVELIEDAERTAPYCLCGRHMMAIAHDDSVWLECSELQRQTTGIGGLLTRLQHLVGHSRSRIMELPQAN